MVGVREFCGSDEVSWVRCRVLSFLDSTYFDDVLREKPRYENPSIELVAVVGNQVVGFLDCEIEQTAGSLCTFAGGRGSVLWQLGVLPEFRHLKVATRLWDECVRRLVALGVGRMEIWTQEDVAANTFYLGKGCVLKYRYLNGYLSERALEELPKPEYMGAVRGLNFEAGISRKDELAPLCDRLHEVRGYEVVFG